MRVKISDFDQGHASTPIAGQQLLALIEPAIHRGESVVLDFEGVKHCGPAFFNWSVGELIEKDTENRIGELIRYENLSALGQIALDMVVENRTRRREDPQWAAGMEEAVRRYAKSISEDWE